MVACQLAYMPAHAEAITVVGSTTFSREIMNPYRVAIEEATGHKLLIISNKSIPGLVELLERRADLAMISAPLEDELSVLRKTVPTLPIDRLQKFEVSQVGLALPVHPTNPVRTATFDALRRVLLGELTNWRDLGGPDIPIRVVLVMKGNDLIVANKFLGKPEIPLKNIIWVHTPVQLVQVVKQEPGALGFTQRALVRSHKLPTLTLDRPLEQPLDFVTLDEPRPAVRAVIDATRRLLETATE